MKTALILMGILVGIMTWAYLEANADFMELATRPVEVQTVAIREVPIPAVYDVSEIDSYCRYDYEVRHG